MGTRKGEALKTSKDPKVAMGWCTSGWQRRAMQEATGGVADAQEGAQGRGSGERAYRKASQQRGLAAGSGKGQRSLEGRKVSKEP